MCWGTGIQEKNGGLNRLIRNADSVISSQLATLGEVVEQMMLTKLLAIMDNISNYRNFQEPNLGKGIYIYINS